MVTLTVLAGAAIPNSGKQAATPSSALCELYPIALHTTTLAGAKPGDVLADILNGTRPGNFGWLTWNGDLSAPALGVSLTPPGDSGRYVNPDNPADHDVSVGDRVRGRPGAVNALAVRKGLDLLKTMDAVVVPVWDETRANGSNATYRVSAFAKVQLLEYRINGNARITVRFLGLAECAAQANRPPLASDRAAETPEDTTKELTVAGSDPDGDPLSFAVVSGPGHGALGPLVGDRVTYTPAPNYNGPDSFTFKANDGALDSNVATFRLTVTPVNDPPVCRDLSAETPFETPVEPSPDCSDVDGDALAYAIAGQGTKGTATVVSGRLRYVPASGQTGTDAFRYRASDGHASSNDATVTITIGPHVNRPPVARDDVLETPEDSGKGLEVLANDSDPDGDTLSVVSWTQGKHGLVTCLPAGSCTYVPAADFAGEDSFTYRVEDGNGASAEATVRATVTAVNDSPVSTDGAAETAEDTAKTIALPATDVDGDTLTFSVLSGPSHGSLGTISGGEVVYTPARDYFGPDSFTFRANDGHEQSAVATVAITVTEVNDPPASANDQFAIGVAESTEIPGAVVLWNDTAGPTNESGQPLDVTAVATGPDSHGVASVTNGVITYTPEQGFSGTAKLGYTVCDKGTTHGVPDPRCATDGVISLDVVASDRPPTANAQERETAEDTTLPVTLTGSDPDGDPITFEVVDPPAHGTLVGTAPALTYAPEADYNGPDEFTFRATDGRLRSEPAKVAVKITEVNDAPVLGEDRLTLGGAGTLPPPPPRPNCGQPCGIIYGDPHLSSFDQAHFDFQAVGEFIAADSTTDDFELQVRAAPVPPLRTVSIATAVAMRVGGHRVGVYRTLDGYDTKVDGAPFTVTPSPRALPGGGTIGNYGRDNEAVVVWPDGSRAIIAAVGLYPQYYRFTVELGLSAPHLTHMVGLLGNADAVKENDVVTRDGVQLPWPAPPFNQLYPHYADTWRISQAESLFDYGPGETTETFTDRTYPDAPVNAGTLPPNVAAAARTQCGLFGVIVEAMLDACTVDVGLTSDPEFASSSAAAQEAAHGIPDNTGVTAIGRSTTVTIGTAGQNAVRSFTATAGQKVTMTLTGNTIPEVDVTIRQPNGNQVMTRFANGPSVFVDTFTLPVEGTYTVTVDPRALNTGSLTFELNSVPDNTGTTAIGQSTTVGIGTIGENAVRTFTATAGQKVTMFLSDNTIDEVDVTVRQPNTGVVASRFLNGPSAFVDTFTLPVTGTYTISIDPRAQNTGSLTFRLEPVPENTGTTAIGQSTTVAIGTIGENAVRTFTATAGQKVTMFVSDNTIPGVDLTVRQPNTGAVAGQFLNGPSAFHDTFTLPVTGTYTVSVDPRDQNTGSLTFRLQPVPDNTGTTAIGQATDITIGTVGENAVRTFTATAGQKATLFVSANTIPGVDITVRQPNTGAVGGLFVSGSSGFRDTFTLPVAGTYTITIDPRDQNVGGLTFRLEAVPDNTGTTTIGQATDITIGTIGENAVRTFPGTAGQKVTLSVANNTIPGVDLTIRQPNTGSVGGLFVSGPSGFRDVMTLPVNGTYTITIDPRDQNTGSLSFTLNEVAGGASLQPSLLALQTGAAGEAATAATTNASVTAADAQPVLQLTVAEVLANDRPGPPNESDQHLTVTGVHTSGDTHGTATLANGVITYTPNLNYVGPATFTYTACDDGTTTGQPDPRCADGAVVVKVTANNPPTVVGQQKTTQEDVAIAVLLTASDPDGDAVGFRVTQAPDHGTLTGGAPNLTYRPAPNFHGTDAFRFAANDGHDESVPATVAIAVTEVNDVPSAQPDSITGGVGRTASVAATTLLRNDSAGPFDERGQVLTIPAVTATPDTHGTVALIDGAVTYEPEAGFTGTAKVLYTLCDNGTTNGAADPRCTTGQLSIVANQAPTATAQSRATLRNTPVTITLAGSDAESDVLSFAIASAPAHGTLTGSGDTRVYTPEAGYSGPDSFTFTAADAYNTSAPAIVSIDVAATPPPVIKPDAAATATNTSVLIDVLANDTAAAGSLDPATLAVVGAPTNGTAVVETGKIRYTPAAGVAPNDRFTYQVCDTFGICGGAEVTVSATVPNRAPVAKADSYQADAGATLDVAAPGLLGNDSDPDPGDAIQARLGTGVSAGNLLLRFDGSFRYTPSPGFAGLDRFTYFIIDRAGLTSSPVTVTIDVVPLGPAAIDDNYTTTKDNPLVVMPAGVLANDRDAHTKLPLTAVVDRRSFRGDVDLNPDGSFVYTPDPGFTGTDTFRYLAVDIRGVASAFGVVGIEVTAPTCALPTVDHVTPADASKVTAPANVTANVAPPAGETIAKWKVTARNQDRGTPVVLASGTGTPPSTLATFDPTTLVNGPYQLLVSVEASGGCTTTATSNVFVAGDMKLGDYQTKYLDMDTEISGIPVQVFRTYDTTDSRLGDFGVGWRLSLGSYRATPNNKLGQGGWFTEPFGFPFTRFRFKTTVPHFVTVTSPSGRVEVFDLVPAPSGPLLSLTIPEFVPRPGTGTTSKLEDADPPTLSLAGNSLADFFGGTIYDPTLFKLTTKDGIVLIIDRFGGLKSITDRNGNKLIVSADGVSSSATDRHLTFVRDGAGRITEIRGAGGKRTQYTYSGAGDLRSFTAANGGVDAFTYNGSHRLLTVDGPGDTRVRTLNYGPDGRVTSITDGAGNTTSVSSDVDARSQITTSPSGRLTTFLKYGADGNLATKEEVFSGHSRVTSYEYDAEGRVTKTTSPLGRVETLTYDAAGNITSRTTPKNEKWTYAFNSFNEPTTTTGPDGGVVESYTYDAKGILTSVNLRDGTAATLTNDSRGLPTTMTDAFGTASFAYDADQQVTTATDQAGGITRMAYDAAGRLVSSENPAGEVTQVSWNALDKPVLVTAANGSTQAWTYDAFGRLTSSIDAGGRMTTYEYDSDDRLVRSVDRNGRTTTYAYDKDGNLASRHHADGSVENSGWDPVKRMVSLSDADTIVDFAYNDADDVISQRSRGNNGVGLPDVTLSYSTDPNGRRTSAAGPGGTVNYTYDSRGRLSSVRDEIGGLFSPAYDNTDRLMGLSRPNGITDALSYRGARLTQRDASLGGTMVGRADYTLDALGRRTSLTDLDGVHTFTHDLADRLTAALRPPASGLPDESFAYDKVGNRSSWVGSPPGSVSYDAGMRLLSDGTYDYTYDGEGRMTLRRNRGTGDVTRYTWNDAGQLTAVTAPDASVSNYRYDAFGRRVEVNDDGAIRRFVYSGWNLRNEFDGANALRATYVAGLFPDGVYEIVRGSARYYPLFDGVGSVTALTDATGAAVGRVRYSAFGVPQSSGVTENAVSFTGHQFDVATGLVYARARYYDPTIGRFLNQDPEWAVNPYVYALDAPLEFTDPTGRTVSEEATTRREFGWLYNRYIRIGKNPTDAKNLAEYIVKQGPEVIKRALRGAFDLSKAP
ncbi:MAG: Ig-like domain-containing protein [Gaiellaceae bacterium]